MPSYYMKTTVSGVPLKICEVNPRRETLTVINYNPRMLVLADDDQPSSALNSMHGIPIFPYSSLTLKRVDGDEPDKAWYVYAEDTLEVIMFEGMTPLRKRWW